NGGPLVSTVRVPAFLTRGPALAIIIPDVLFCRLRCKFNEAYRHGVACRYQAERNPPHNRHRECQLCEFSAAPGSRCPMCIFRLLMFHPSLLLRPAIAEDTALLGR